MTGRMAQLAEQRIENFCVTGSVLVLGIAGINLSKSNRLCGCSSVVEHQPSKLDMWVRFPSPAFLMQSRKLMIFPIKSRVCDFFLF